MRRIFSILAVVFLVVAMAVPVFAEEVYTISGKWGFDLSYDTTSFPFGLPQPIVGTVNGEPFVRLGKDSSGIHFYKYVSGTGTVLSIGLKETVSVVIDFAEQEVDASVYNWVYNDGYEIVCDGSTCPATDVNHDNICDDCGMMFSVLRDYTPSDFPSGYPAVPSLGNPYARYYLYRVISSDRIYIVAYPSTVTPTYDSTKQNGQLYFSESYGNYRLDTTNNEWVLSSEESPYTIGGNNSTSVENLYSSVQIYDENGDPFFPIPLWMEMEKVTQGEMQGLTVTTAGTIQTLALCGVGLMALLVVLSLFGKRSLIFRR